MTDQNRHGPSARPTSPGAPFSAARIRVAGTGDAAAISALVRATLPVSNAADYPPEVIRKVSAGFSPEAVAGMLARRLTFVALAPGGSGTDGTLLGTAALDAAVVRTVFVHPRAQGRGIGRALMERVEEEARRRGIRTLSLPASLTGVPFYERLGYRPLREIRDGAERTIVMEKTLPTA